MMFNDMDGSFELTTPGTNENYVHLKAVIVLNADDTYNVSPVEISLEGALNITVSDKKIKSGLRGSGVVLHFYNENGEEWNQIFQFHKGNTYVKTSTPKKIVPETKKFWW